MKTNRKLLAAGVSVVVAAAGGGASAAIASGNHPATSHGSSSTTVLKVATVTVQAGSKTVKRSVLVNGSGRAVYILSGDTTTRPKCTSSSCHANWPAVTTSAKHPAGGKGVSGKVAVWRHNGSNQITISGHPVYTFAGDPGAGKAFGEGVMSFGGTWTVVSPSGSAVSVSSSKGSSGYAW